jgi:hypothetical protein
MWIRRLAFHSLALLALLPLNAQQRPVNPDLRAGIQTLDIAPVWSGHPVGFALLTTGDHQYAAFYAADRSMTVAERKLGEREWSFKRLPTAVGWDTHNFITMAIDRGGFLHVMGNMHASPLVYFRETIAGDASSLRQVSAMTGHNELKVTYPVFSKAPDGALLLEYRSGGSGSGDTLINRYEERTQSWSPLTDQPLFSGGGKMNAYPMSIVKGPDGWFHEVWVWRDSPMAETNHDLSYARSRDRVHWETAGGQPLTLPLTIATKGITVDAAPVHGGLLNGTQAVGFDADGRVVISYLKYDGAGNTQMYFARFEGGRWVSRQATQWSYRWDFHGGGSLGTQIHIGPLQSSDGKLAVAIDHKVYGAGVWEVDPATLKLTGQPKLAPSTVHGLEEDEQVSATKLFDRTAEDAGVARGDGVRYTLHWQTLGEYRDHPRPGGAPAPAMLTLRIQKVPQ